MVSGRLMLAMLGVTALAGCGGGDSGDSTTTARTSATAPAAAAARIDPAFIGRADAVCAEAVHKNEKNGTFPVKAFDPAHPRKADLPVVGAFFAKNQRATDAAVAKLAALGAPASGRDEWTRVLALARQVEDTAHTEAATAKAADVAGFVAAVRRGMQVSSLLGARAVAAGFANESPCGKIF